jgi:hypothetical protein
MVLDNGRTIIIWIVTLAVKWEIFHPLPILGFILLVTGKFNFCELIFFKYFIIHLGMGIYNGVWEHLYRRYVKGEKDDSEREELVANDHENKQTDVYITPNKDSVT